MKFPSTVIPALMAMACLLSCGRNNEEKDLLYDKFLSSTVDVPFDRMAFVGEDSLWREHTPYTYVCYADSVTCSSCLATHLSVWQIADEQLGVISNSCRLCLIVPGDTSTVSLIRQVLYYVQYRPCMYVDTAGVFPEKNPLVDSLRVLHSFLMDKDGKVLLVGDPTKRDMTEEVRRAITPEK